MGTWGCEGQPERGAGPWGVGDGQVLPEPRRPSWGPSSDRTPSTGHLRGDTGQGSETKMEPHRQQRAGL